MSFTNEELQSFNTILEQKLGQQRRELERSFDTRLQVFKREIEQRLAYTQKELVRVLSQHLSEQYRQIKGTMNFNGVATPTTSSDETILDLSELELHTELPLDELTAAVSQALDERFSNLTDTLKTAISTIKQQFVMEMQMLQNKANSTQDMHIIQSQPFEGTSASMQDVFVSIERLEHIIESMQVAMTSNSALLSNRLYHHQQLPLERAHPSSQQDGTLQNTTTRGHLPLPKE